MGRCGEGEAVDEGERCKEASGYKLYMYNAIEVERLVIKMWTQIITT